MFIKKHSIVLFFIGLVCCIVAAFILLRFSPAGLYEEILSATVSGCLFSFPNFILSTFIDSKQIMREFSNSLKKLEDSLISEDSNIRNNELKSNCSDAYYKIIDLVNHYNYFDIHPKKNKEALETLKYKLYKFDVDGPFSSEDNGNFLNENVSFSNAKRDILELINYLLNKGSKRS